MLTAKMKQLKAGKALVDSGAVTDAYIQAMIDREQVVVSTFMGNGLAISHGTDEAKNKCDSLQV